MPGELDCESTHGSAAVFCRFYILSTDPSRWKQSSGCQECALFFETSFQIGVPHGQNREKRGMIAWPSVQQLAIQIFFRPQFSAANLTHACSVKSNSRWKLRRICGMTAANLTEPANVPVCATGGNTSRSHALTWQQRNSCKVICISTAQCCHTVQPNTNTIDQHRALISRGLPISSVDQL